MSDGPHRSLPMRKPWKELAKQGDQGAYDSEQLADAASSALASDFKKEVSWALLSALKSIFNGLDNSLGFSEIAIQQLEETKSLTAGSVFGANLVAWSIELVNEGKFGSDALCSAIGLAAKTRGFANVRSVEEHYLRKSNQQRAENVGNRLYRTISGLSETQLGSELMAPKLAKPRLQKKTGLDDGVPR